MTSRTATTSTTTTTARGEETEPGVGPDRWSPGRLAAHHLIPGLASLALFVPLARLASGAGQPLMLALFGAVLLGEVPVSWFLMVRALRARGRPVRMATLFPWRRPVGPFRLVGLGLPMAVVGLVLVGGIAGAAEPALKSAFFAWLPEWLSLTSGPADMLAGGRTGLLALWVASGVVGVGVGGVTQELYHRGFLLPRAGHLGWWAVPFNAVLFAVMHLAAPWGWPFFFLASLPWAAAVYRWRSVQLGLAGHVGMLALGWLMMTAMVTGLVPVPTP